METRYQTNLGNFYLGDSNLIPDSDLGNSLLGNVQLILTSPPFPLNSKKSYGNLEGDEYLNWFIKLAPVFSKLLKNDGSIVIEVLAALYLPPS